MRTGRPRVSLRRSTERDEAAGIGIGAGNRGGGELEPRALGLPPGRGNARPSRTSRSRSRPSLPSPGAAGAAARAARQSGAPNRHPRRPDSEPPDLSSLNFRRDPNLHGQGASWAPPPARLLVMAPGGPEQPPPAFQASSVKAPAGARGPGPRAPADPGKSGVRASESSHWQAGAHWQQALRLQGNSRTAGGAAIYLDEGQPEVRCVPLPGRNLAPHLNWC
jgi:hypothetical protein